MIAVRPGELDTLVSLQRPVADLAIDGAGSGTWVQVDEIWVGILDRLPSRGERDNGGFVTATRAARVRMYWRSDVTADMRLVLDDRIMQIVTEPAELGRRAGLEVMVEDYRPGGNTA